MVRGAAVLAALLLSACASTEPESGAVPRFGAPERLPSPVSTDGWEDSGYVTPDGGTLYFTYLRIDPVTYLETGQIRVTGPRRPGWPDSPYDTLGAELYRATRVGDTWSEPENLGAPVNRPDDLEGDEWVSEDGNRILFTNGVVTAARPEQGIYYAERHQGIWQTPVLARAVGFPFVAFDENPHLTRDEKILFFESSRPGGFGRQDIWMSVRSGSTWSTPVNLGTAINTDGVEGSPWSLDGSELYFDDKGGGTGISWSRHQADGTWSPRQVVIPGGFGDPSLTLTGDLYAVGGRVTATGFDADLYRFPRLR